MADLKCNHLKDETVYVRGTAYEVDNHGVCKGVSEEHAKIMCQGSWKRVSVSAPAPAPKATPTPETKPTISATPTTTQTAPEPKKKPKRRSSSGRKPKRDDT